MFGIAKMAEKVRDAATVMTSSVPSIAAISILPHTPLTSSLLSTTNATMNVPAAASTTTTSFYNLSHILTSTSFRMLNITQKGMYRGYKAKKLSFAIIIMMITIIKQYTLQACKNPSSTEFESHKITCWFKFKQVLLASKNYIQFNIFHLCVLHICHGL